MAVSGLAVRHRGPARAVLGLIQACCSQRKSPQFTVGLVLEARFFSRVYVLNVNNNNVQCCSEKMAAIHGQVLLEVLFFVTVYSTCSVVCCCCGGSCAPVYVQHCLLLLQLLLCFYGT